MKNTLLATGPSGLIDSEVVSHFCKLGWQVHGVNNICALVFFPGGDTRWNQEVVARTFEFQPS
jgi:hypothetical protein